MFSICSLAQQLKPTSNHFVIIMFFVKLRAVIKRVACMNKQSNHITSFTREPKQTHFPLTQEEFSFLHTFCQRNSIFIIVELEWIILVKWSSRLSFYFTRGKSILSMFHSFSNILIKNIQNFQLISFFFCFSINSTCISEIILIKVYKTK